MENPVRNRRPQKAVAAPLADNAIARKAIEAIQQIDKEAQERKLVQLESLRSAKAALHERINELTHQLQQIDNAIAAIRGKPEPTAKAAVAT